MILIYRMCQISSQRKYYPQWGRKLFILNTYLNCALISEATNFGILALKMEVKPLSYFLVKALIVSNFYPSGYILLKILNGNYINPKSRD